MIEFELEKEKDIKSLARIKVLGIGGGGNNMVNSMLDAISENATFIVANTDSQALKSSKAPHKIQLGVKSAKGLGSGANPEVGRRSAEEDLDRIVDSVRDADIVFLTGGLGGGTGSGALPVVARALKERDILTVAVVTKPFTFEGRRRMKIANDALNLIKREVDTLIVLPNQKLIDVADQKVSLIDAFSMINTILTQFIKGLFDIVERPGYINVDFADIKSIMKQKGYALIGSGRASGDDRAYKATVEAISSQLLENVDIVGASGILLNIAGPSTLGLHEVSAAASLIYDKAHEDANIVLGSIIDDSLDQDIIVTVIATGFTNNIQDIKEADKKEVESKELEKTDDLDNKIDEPKIEQVATKSNDSIEKPNSTVNLDDLDVPTIMRKIAKERELS